MQHVVTAIWPLTAPHVSVSAWLPNVSVWLPSCHTQIRLTGGLQQVLPSFLPPLLFGPPVPIDKLVVDDERHIMYSLSASSALQVCYVVVDVNFSILGLGMVSASSCLNIHLMHE